MRLLLAVLVVAAAPAIHHTAADMKKAHATLLKVSDLGKGWTGKNAPAQHGVALSCKGVSPSGSGIVETGAASSQDLSFGSTGPFISQNTSVYASTAEASAYWQRAVTSSLLTCVVRNVNQLAQKGVKISITSQHRETFSNAVGRSAVYRVVAKANALTLYFDVILLNSNRTITSIVVSRFETKLTVKFEQSIAGIVSSRFNAGPGAA